MGSLVSGAHIRFSHLALFLVCKDVFISKTIPALYYSHLFLHLDSSEEIKEKILSFFDIIISKMSPSQEDIIPLELCQCEEILEVVVMPLAYHFLALGENNKALYYFLETASAYLTLEDNYMVSCLHPALFQEPKGPAACFPPAPLLLEIKLLRQEMT